MTQHDEAIERSIIGLTEVIQEIIAQRREALDWTQKADKKIEMLNKVIEQLKGKPTAYPILLKREVR